MSVEVTCGTGNSRKTVIVYCVHSPHSVSWRASPSLVMVQSPRISMSLIHSCSRLPQIVQLLLFTLDGA